MTFKVTRIFRHFVDGVPQISAFPDEKTDPPTSLLPAGQLHDLGVRIKHFTEIEAFVNLAFLLAHELQEFDDGLTRISTIQNLTVSDPEVQARIDGVKPIAMNNERLADFLEDVGLNWEHFVASFNANLIPGDPLKVDDPDLQSFIDSLDDLTEALVAEVNLRAMKLLKRRRGEMHEGR